MSRDIVALFADLDERADVRAVVVTGDPAGGAFCAGADLDAASGFGGSSTARASAGEAEFRDSGGVTTAAILRCRKPVLAAINGSAVGIGATMTLCMDLRFVAADAKMGFVFVRRGLTPEAMSSHFLPRLVGLTKALDWCLTGRVFRAREEAASGLFTEVLPRADDVLPRAMAVAREMAAKCAPVPLAMTKALLLRGATASPEEAHLAESRCLYHSFTDGDAAEGALSFLQKREPAFPCTLEEDWPGFAPWWRQVDVRSRL